MFVTKTRATAFDQDVTSDMASFYTTRAIFAFPGKKQKIPFVKNILTFVPTPSSQDEEIKEDMLHPF